MSDYTYVYIIAKIRGNKPLAPVKIGISSNPQKRIAGLQTASPFPLVLLATFFCSSRKMAEIMEAGFHDIHADRRLSGEWFSISPMEAVELACEDFRTALDVLIDDEDLREIALNHSGIKENEEKLAKWKAYAARHLNDNGASQ